MQLTVDSIRTDGGTQSRAQINWLTVTDYAADIAEGATFPPVVVYFDGADYWLADGFHRLEAHKRLGLVEIAADVKQGTRRDAILYSVKANALHGLRRTMADIERAVLMLKDDAEWSQWPQGKVAEVVGCSRATVNRIIARHPELSCSQNKIVVRNGQIYTMDTANIGQRVPEFVDNPATWHTSYAYAPLEDAPPQMEPWPSPDLAILKPAPETRPHVAYNAGNNEWYTPPEYIAAAVEVMGGIDLDPATSEAANTVVGAARIFTAQDDGLLHFWQGRVWMNPPYASELVGRFADKLALHASVGDVTEAIVLVNNATETAWFNTLVGVASAVVFPRARVRFWQPGGTFGAPLQGQAVIYIGPSPAKFLDAFRRFGWGATL